MSRILFAWEMGENFGHLVACLRVAEELRRRGHSVAFAVRDTRVAAEVLTPAGFSFVQAPNLVGRLRSRRAPVSFSEILLDEGYGDIRGLFGGVLAWRTLLQLTGPNVIVAEYAPTALLAAHSLAIASVAMGNGFGIPPDICPLPSIRPWDAISDARLKLADASINTAIAQILKMFGCQNEASIADLYRSSVICTFPELDPYGVRLAGDYIGPIFSLSQVQNAVWAGYSSKKILAYLRKDMAGFDELISALSNSGAESLCIVLGLSRQQASRLTTPSLRIITEPLALDDLLKQADIFVTYGGSGAVSQALLAGVPLLIAPRFVEQHLNAQRVRELGAAIVVENKRGQEDFGQAIATLLGNTTYRDNARSFARRHCDFSPQHAAVLAARRIEQVGEGELSMCDVND